MSIICHLKSSIVIVGILIMPDERTTLLHNKQNFFSTKRIAVLMITTSLPNTGVFAYSGFDKV